MPKFIHQFYFATSVSVLTVVANLSTLAYAQQGACSLTRIQIQGDPELQKQLDDEYKRAALACAKKQREAAEAPSVQDSSAPMKAPTEAGTKVDKTDAVPIESAVLAYSGVEELAKIIQQRIRSSIDKLASSAANTIIIYDKSSFDDLVVLRTYQDQVDRYEKAFTTIKKVCKSISGSSNPQFMEFSSIPLTLGLRSAIDVLALFRSRDQVSIVNDLGDRVTDQSITKKVMAELMKPNSNIKVIQPNNYFLPSKNGLKAIFDQLSSLRAKSEKVKEETVALEKKIKLEKEEQKKELLQNELACLGQLYGSVSRFLDSIENGKQEDILKLVKAYDLNQALENQALILEIKKVTSGALRTRDSLFTTVFSGSRLTYSGGVVIQYTLSDSNGSILSTDTLHYVSGFKAVGESMSR
jgi:hypothetical protein